MTYHATADAMPTAYVQFPAPSFRRIRAQQALTDAHRRLGLMHRSVLPDHRGMLLSWPDASTRKMWMRNTHIPLDAIFIAGDGTIVGILKELAPMHDDLETVGVPAQHVLEVNAGWVERHGVATGQRVSIAPATELPAAAQRQAP